MSHESPDRKVCVAAVAGFTLLAAGMWRVARQYASSPAERHDYGRTEERAGPFQPEGAQRHLTPDNHVLTPAGRQVELQGMRPNAVALSPDGQLLVAAGTKSMLVCIDPASGHIIDRVPLPPEASSAPQPVSENILAPDLRAKLSFTGLAFSADGARLFLSNVNGSIKVFQVDAEHRVRPRFSIPLPAADAPERKEEIPAGLVVSDDGARLYAALNLSNRLAEIDVATGTVLQLWDTGVAPFDVKLARGKAYVSNWGGRRPDDASRKAHAGQGTTVRVDENAVASEGSITIIDLQNGRERREIVTGRHASALAIHPQGTHVVCACAADDFVTVIDTLTDEVVEKIWPKRTPADLFGAAPNALAFDASGGMLYICNGSQNAVAVVGFSPGKSELEGLIPTAWYPGGIAFDAKRQQLAVANIKGLGSWERIEEGKPRVWISGNQFGTLSLIPLPDQPALEEYTGVVLANARGPALRTALLPPRRNMAPRPVPERHGEPSVFKYVLYVIKENRTYDQVLGDMPQGNGDADLCIFGEEVTPNQHQLSRDFVLLDNTYCSGVLSADGHNWSCSAITTDYVERSFSGWPRSYPDGSEAANADALAWSPAGFIWDAARREGRTVRVYGEFADIINRWNDPARQGTPSWTDVWDDFQKGTGLITIGGRATIDTLTPVLCSRFAAWENEVTDVQRAAVFIDELRAWEMSGDMPNLMVMSLPMDHTSGTVAGFPTPASQVADNDLAFGKLVEAVSHSRFWKDTCIVAIEDDPQNGWDHVSAYRTTAYVVSPWTKRGAVVRTQYNQTSVLRTIELILGLKPMHELDAIATPMFDCFTDRPDFTPWKSLPNRIPLDDMNPAPVAIADPLLREHALASAKLPFHKLDACPEGALNRILWHSVKGPHAPYPEWAEGHEAEEDE